jgi:hypothetical protein
MREHDVVDLQDLVERECLAQRPGVERQRAIQ